MVSNQAGQESLLSLKQPFSYQNAERKEVEERGRDEGQIMRDKGVENQESEQCEGRREGPRRGQHCEPITEN